tara:strand:- start:57 stop:659 length:603 start_codon:yes stop_codon:yes gene_type:complete
MSTSSPAINSLEQLQHACGSCQLCGLAASRTHVVVSRGNPEARLMLIGEGPGQMEDESGRPFVGRAGQLLDRIMESVGLSSERDAYICNVVKCRPPGNRKPTKIEMAACKPWLEAQIRLVNPALIVVAGATAVEALLGIKGGITKLRGHWQERDGRRVLPVFHPSYLLRNRSSAEGSPTWHTRKDMQDVRTRLEQEGWQP